MMSYETRAARPSAATSRHAFDAEVVLVLRREVGRRQDVEIGDQQARRIADDLAVASSTQQPLQSRVVLAEARCGRSARRGRTRPPTRQTTSACSRHSSGRVCGVDAAPDDDRSDRRLDAVAEPGGELVVRRPHAHARPRRAACASIRSTTMSSSCCVGRLIGEVVLEEDRVDVVSALLEQRVEDAERVRLVVVEGRAGRRAAVGPPRATSRSMSSTERSLMGVPSIRLIRPDDPRTLVDAASISSRGTPTGGCDRPYYRAGGPSANSRNGTPRC